MPEQDPLFTEAAQIDASLGRQCMTPNGLCPVFTRYSNDLAEA